MDEELDSAKGYRARAAQLRMKAAKLAHGLNKRMLLDVAANYDHLATSIVGWRDER